MAHQNIIEINGKSYNALTGELLLTTAPQHTRTAHPKAAKSSGQFVDGFIKPAHYKAPVVQAHVPAARADREAEATRKPLAASPLKAVNPIRTAAKPVSAHQPEHAKTLMRRVVKKPTKPLKATAKVQTRTDILAKTPDTFIAPKVSHRLIDTARETRAEHVAKHQLISRFSKVSPAVATAAPAAAPQPRPVHATPRPNIYNFEQIKAARSDHHEIKPAIDIFQRALERAESHTEKLKPTAAHKKSRKIPKLLVSVSAMLATVAVLGGFIAYQNAASLTLKVASTRAGFAANLPSSTPTGFHVGKFQYSPGTVAVNFASNDNRNFQLTQKVSNWDSETLLDNYVIDTAKSYQRVQSNGRTIYMYDNNNATWVSNGVWYQVTSNGSLGSSQLLKLASSI